MIRILQCVNNMHRAGLETMLMNYYRSLDKSRIQFDFLTHRPFKSDYDDEIESLGGKVYYAPRLTPQNYPQYFSYMKKFFHDHPEYKIIHSHIDSMSYLPLLSAKRAGVPIRIAHSHNISIDLDYKYPLKSFFGTRLDSVATDFAACGKEAGEFLFKSKSTKIIPNAINADEFIFSEKVRKEKRQELGITDEFIIGHIGRFSQQKNHSFLLEIFAEIKKLNQSALLFLIGTGENEDKIKEKAEKLGIKSSVRFLGVRSDVGSLYQAFDIFLLPSLYEGVPVVGIEAQFASLPCIFSNRVPKETAFTNNCEFLDLTLSAKKWAEKAISLGGVPRRREEFFDSEYRIENTADKLEKYYIDLLKIYKENKNDKKQETTARSIAR